MNKFLSRKFILTYSVLVTATILISVGLLSENNYVQLVIGVTGLYMGGNVGEWAFNNNES